MGKYWEVIQRKQLIFKKWDSQGDEESRQEYWEVSYTAKREVAKEKACSACCT